VVNPDDMQAVNTPLGADRIRALADIIDEYPSDEPLVIFAKFRYEMDAILALLEKQGRTSGIIAGGVPQPEKTKASRAFQAGRFNAMVVQIRAGGIAIDLSRADNAIFYSMTHSFIDYEQAKARIIARTGGKKSFIHLSARGTVDDDIIESGRHNADLAKAVLQKLDD
jgi:superfamily II DNA/RNA helicase